MGIKDRFLRRADYLGRRQTTREATIYGFYLWIPLTVFGIFARLIWTPFVILVASYLLIDLIVEGIFDFDHGASYLHLFGFVKPKRVTVRGRTVLIGFVVAIVVSAAVAFYATHLAIWIDGHLNPIVTAFFWSYATADLLARNVLLRYLKRLDPPNRNQKTKPAPR